MEYDFYLIFAQLVTMDISNSTRVFDVEKLVQVLWAISNLKEKHSTSGQLQSRYDQVDHRPCWEPICYPACNATGARETSNRRGHPARAADGRPHCTTVTVWNGACTVCFYASYRSGLTVESSRGLGVGRNYGGTTDGRTDMDHNGDDVQSAAERTGVDGIHYRAETGIRRFFVNSLVRQLEVRLGTRSGSINRWNNMCWTK